MDLDKLTETAVQQSLNELVSNFTAPNSTSQFEKNLDQFKKGPDMLFSYVKQIPLDLYGTFYNNKEIPPNYLLQLCRSLFNQGVKTDAPASLNIITALSKTNKLSLTIMFLSKKEKEEIKQLLDALKAPESLFTTF